MKAAAKMLPDAATTMLQMIEAHGTGTALGDPTEMASICGVVDKCRESSNPIAIGASKTNIGHAEAAAGIAGFIKTLLTVQHQDIPPNLHLHELNPLVVEAIGAMPTLFPFQAISSADPNSYPLLGTEAVLGTNSFGFSGTIAHTLVQLHAHLPGEAKCIDACTGHGKPLGRCATAASSRLQ